MADVAIASSPTATSASCGPAPRARTAFGLTPFALADFEPGRHYHTTSPESHFTARRVISLLTPDGRVTLRDDRLIVTAGDDKREELIAGAGEWRRLAAERFGIDLDRG